MSRNIQALRIVSLGVLLSIGFSLLLWLFPKRAELAENNFQANVIRLQSFLFDASPRAVLVGSSMTGRLLPRYFANTPLEPVINLGLDGSGPALGLELTLKKPPPLVLIEVNQILKPRDGNDELLENVSQTFTFRLSRYLPVLRAHSRPSSILYSWLKNGRNHNQEDVKSPVRLSNNILTPSTNTPPQADLVPLKAKLRSQIHSLREAGCRIVLLRMPAGESTLTDQSPASIFANELVQEFDILQIDLPALFASEHREIAYTDGLHLTPASSLDVCTVLVSLLKEQDAQRRQVSKH
jgi:hypothetical protein